MTKTSLVSGRLLGDGKYELLSTLGQGAMGVVWLARHVALDRMVAVKFLHSDLQLGRALANTIARKEFASERFLKEARTASLLRHRNTVQLLDYGADHEDRWLVMEYLEGKNLSDELFESGTFDAARSIAIVSQVLAALAEAHDFGIVHRDLKPANVMLVPWVDDDGRETELAKVLDFGIATMMSDGVADTNEVAGTPEYMSPEQAQALEVDQRSDVYAAGILLYHLLTGDTPFSDPSPMNTMLAHVNTPPRPPSQVNPAISHPLEALILSSLEKSPDDRPESARAFRSALLALPEARGLRPDSSPRLDPVTSVPPVSTSPATSSAPRVATLAYAAPATPEPARKSKVALWVVLSLLVLTGGALFAAGVFSPAPAPNPDLAATPPPDPTTTEVAAMPEPLVPASAEPVAPAPDAAEAAAAQAPQPAPTPELAVDVATAATMEGAVPADGETKTNSSKIEISAPAPVSAEPAEDDTRVAQVVVDKPARPRPEARPVAETAPVAAAAPKADTAPKPQPATAPQQPTPTEAKPAQTTAAQPTTPAPVEPKPVAPEPVRPASLSASASIAGLQSRGSLPRSALARAIDGARSSFEGCYASGARAVGRDQAGQVVATVVFDIDGKVSAVNVGAFGLDGVATCIDNALWRVRLRERPDTGSVDTSFRIVFTPR